MLFILEIAFTVAAWRKGWGPRAALPLVFAFGMAFILGAVMGASGYSASDLALPGFLCDLGTVIALIVMIRHAPVSVDRLRIAPPAAGQQALNSPTST